MKNTKLIAFVAVLALTSGMVRAQDSALLDLLVKKKVITDQEAEETRAEMAKEFASVPAGKINISAPVSQIKLYGDARVRYEWREGHSMAAGGSDTASADRFRYRLRIGADVTLTDNWFLGIRLETGNGARSTNVTASNGGSSIADFGKGGTATTAFVTSSTATTTVTQNGAKTVTKTTTTVTSKTANAVTKVDFGNAIFLGQLYLKYTPFSWLTIEGGRMPNPFISTPMVWDPDINPEGFAEQFKYTVESGERTVDLFGNFGQFVYDTATPQNQFGATVGRNDSWMFEYQVGAKFNFTKTISFQLAPSFYHYSGERNNDFSTAFNGDPGGNQTGIDNLAVIDMPVEFDWEAYDLPFAFFGDFAYNVEGKQRARAAGHAGMDESAAYQAGLSVGKIKKKGDWQLLAYWQHSEQYSLDPNLIDDDIFDAHLNMEGIVIRANYALTDTVSLGLSYNHGEIINKNLGTGGAGGTLNGSSSSPALQNYNLIQADLNLKF